MYKDVPAAHDFLVAAFGFKPGGVERDPGGRSVRDVAAHLLDSALRRIAAAAREPVRSRPSVCN